VLISSVTTDIILENVYLILNVSAIIESAVRNPHLSKWWGRNKKLEKKLQRRPNALMLVFVVV